MWTSLEQYGTYEHIHPPTSMYIYILTHTNPQKHTGIICVLFISVFAVPLYSFCIVFFFFFLLLSCCGLLTHFSHPASALSCVCLGRLAFKVTQASNEPLIIQSSTSRDLPTQIWPVPTHTLCSEHSTAWFHLWISWIQRRSWFVSIWRSEVGARDQTYWRVSAETSHASE